MNDMEDTNNHNFKIYSDETKNDEINLKNLINLFIRNKLLITSSTLLVTLLTIFSTYLVKPIYKGSFQIFVKKEAKASNQIYNSSLTSVLLSGGGSIQKKTQEFILKSSSVLEPVFNFVNKEYFNKSNEKLTYEDWYSGLNIKFEEGTNILKITYKNSDKDFILSNLKLISKEYQNYSKKEKEKDLKKEKSYLEQQQKILNKKSMKSLRELNIFSIENGLGDIDGFVDMGTTLSRGDEKLLDSELFDQLNSSNLRGQSNLVNRLNLKKPKAGQRFNNQFMLLEKYEAEYINYSSKLKPNSRVLIDLKTKIDRLRASLKRPNEILIKYRELTKIAARDENILNNVERNLALTNLEIARQTDPWILISVPKVSDVRVYPKRSLAAILSFLSSLLISFYLVNLKEHKSGQIFEFNKLKKFIEKPFIETVYLSNTSLSEQLISSILRKIEAKEDNLDKLTYCFINLSTKDNDRNFEIFFKNIKSKNFRYSNFEDRECLSKSKYIFFIVSSSQKVTKEDLLLANKYINIYSDKVPGWFYLDCTTKI